MFPHAAFPESMNKPYKMPSNLEEAQLRMAELHNFDMEAEHDEKPENMKNVYAKIDEMSDFEEDLETEGTELDIAIVTSTYKPALQWTESRTVSAEDMTNQLNAMKGNLSLASIIALKDLALVRKAPLSLLSSSPVLSNIVDKCLETEDNEFLLEGLGLCSVILCDNGLQRLRILKLPVTKLFSQNLVHNDERISRQSLEGLHCVCFDADDIHYAARTGGILVNFATYIRNHKDVPKEEMDTIIKFIHRLLQSEQKLKEPKTFYKTIFRLFELVGDRDDDTYFSFIEIFKLAGRKTPILMSEAGIERIMPLICRREKLTLSHIELFVSLTETSSYSCSLVLPYVSNLIEALGNTNLREKVFQVFTQIIEDNDENVKEVIGSKFFYKLEKMDFKVLKKAQKMQLSWLLTSGTSKKEILPFILKSRHLPHYIKWSKRSRYSHLKQSLEKFLPETDDELDEEW